MERRWTTRTEIKINLDVTTADSVLAGCVTQDIGLGGVYVETQNNNVLAEGDEVELTFSLKDETDDVAPTIKAKVMRLTEDGAGLMFRDFDAIAFRSLQKVIKSQSM